ncbi:hypothetical protein HNQ95_001846 [Aminobacter ciceronei]|uniref:Transposase n=1 Tax=Aminobacter ciceronei TaxID=150723 RepID=A0ABR6C4D6_9HYPH|nr:hypothetical protein [Aminobacter ciceronei]MBA9019852.1 hypothetical protein [Aminobacter ciceronei]
MATCDDLLNSLMINIRLKGSDKLPAEMIPYLIRMMPMRFSICSLECRYLA